jgi:hypothetical protein
LFTYFAVAHEINQRYDVTIIYFSE